MSLTLLTPRYSHRPVSRDEKVGRAIVDAEGAGYGQDKIPDRCGYCGCAGSARNPLMGRPLFLMDHGGPKGTLYRIRCSECQERKAGKRR